MKTIGIIAEFNPFHNGHKYLIEKAKQVTKADNVVVVMSGNYVQRGEPAIIDKYTRTKAALLNGADLVLELPVIYSTGSAELFARAAVKMLDKLGCIDYLCFGCETDNIKNIPTLAQILLKEPDEYKTALKASLKNGDSFPKARMNAVIEYCRSINSLNELEVFNIMTKPNNILAIEYIKALKHFNSSIKPVAIKRVGSDYNNEFINNEFSSATAIRLAMQNKKGDKIKKCVPDISYNDLINTEQLFMSDFDMIYAHVLSTTNKFSKYYGISDELSNRIKNNKYSFTSIENFIETIKTKNITHSSISRCILRSMLNIKKEYVEECIANDYFMVGRILGFNKSTNLLNRIKSYGDIELISKLSVFYKNCDDASRKLMNLSIKSDDLYRFVYMTKYKTEIKNEFKQQIVLI